MKRFLHWQASPIVVFLLLMGLTGVALAGDYGRSVDDAHNVAAGHSALAAYKWSFIQDQHDPYYHGTAYFMPYYALPLLATRFAARFQASTIPAEWIMADLRHFMNFAMFVMTAVGMYSIARRFLKPWPSLVPVLLFVSQPVLFGHAFINQKDTPFMALFTLSMALGLSAGAPAQTRFPFAGQAGASPREAQPSVRSSLRQNWAVAPRRLRGWLLGALVLLVASLAMLVERRLALSLWDKVMPVAQFETRTSGMGRLVLGLLGDTSSWSQEALTGRLHSLWLQAILLLFALCLLAALLLGRRVFRGSMDRQLSSWFPQPVTLLISACVLGLATAVRVMAPLAGVLVSLFHLQARKVQAVGGLVVYWFVAALVTYFSWPNLWGDALGRFWARLVASTDFASHILLFDGIYRSSRDLPWYFLPKLLALQLTEPVLLLGLLGLTLAGLAAWRKQVSRPVLAVLLAWFLLPCGAQVILRTPIYGNFRHLLFTLPPLFLLSGYGLVRGLEAFRWPWLRGMLMVAVLSPGLVGILQLHPLEYAYFNSFIGGSRGAVKRYELDYWCTALRPAVLEANRIAEAGAGLLINGPAVNVSTYARRDLTFAQVIRKVNWPQGDYILTCRDLNVPKDLAPRFEVVARIERAGVIFGEILHRKPDALPAP